MFRPAVLLCALVCCTRGAPRDAFSSTVTLAVLTALEGTTEPCGCTSKPLGGLDRVAAHVEALRAAGPAELLVVGDTFYTHESPPPGQEEQEQKKAETIASVLAALGPLAVLLGPGELERARPLERKGLPIFSPPRTQATALRPDSILRTLGGLSVGILGIPGNAAADAAALTAGAVALRNQGAEVVVALLPHSGAEAEALAARLDAINVLIAAGSDELRPPRVVDGVLLVEAGDRGRYVGELRFNRPAPADPAARPAWVFDDEGQAERAGLSSRAERLRLEIERLEPGPARDARTLKLAEIEARLAQPPPPGPAGPHVTWRTFEVTKAVAPAAWATAQLAAYNRSLCEVTARATADRTCEPAASLDAGYAGTAKCASCHPDDHAVWIQTKHAKAWATLEQAGKQCDLGCIGCHTVGWEKPGGICRVAQAPEARDVGCESCHGPGAGHAAAPFDRKRRSAAFTRGRDAAVCAGCHTPEHSDLFDFETYLPKILGPGHGG